MYAIFSKLFAFIFSPFNWIVVLLLIAFFAKRPQWKRRSLAYAVIILIFFSNPFLLSLYARNWDVAPAPLKKGKVYGAAIILGGFTNEDKTGNGFYNEYCDRLIEGVRLKTIGQVSHIMVSGGNNPVTAHIFKESVWVRKTLKDFSFPDSVILIDQKSTNTVQNAAYTRVVLAQAQLKPPYVLVTSAFHMRRAMYIFKKRGMDVLPYPCNYIAGNTRLGPADYFIPSIIVLNNWGLYIKELFGLAVAHIQSL